MRKKLIGIGLSGDSCNDPLHNTIADPIGGFLTKELPSGAVKITGVNGTAIGAIRRESSTNKNGGVFRKADFCLRLQMNYTIMVSVK